MSLLALIDLGRIKIHNASRSEVDRMGAELEEMISDYMELQEVEFEYNEESPDDNETGGFRSSDPDTSKQGAIDAYPRTGKQRHTALLAIAEAGDRGMTYEEVEQATGINSVWKRLSELKEGGWIFDDGERLVQGTGSMGSVYKITDRARRHIETKERAGVISDD